MKLNKTYQEGYTQGVKDTEDGYKLKEEQDKYYNQADTSTTRIARTTSGCCGGYHQTIAGALLKSKYWAEWYNHAQKNMLWDVDETQECDGLSDGHFEDFIKFTIENSKHSN